MMAAPEGNRFWELRSSHGRSPKFESPDDLWSAACEWFEWVENNPLQEEKLFNYQGELVKGTINKMRAMTLQGLCTFLGIGMSTFNDYTRKEDFSAVTKEIESIIYNQKFVGAAGDMLNANIIARDLGLSDKKEVDNNHSFKGMSDEELDEKIKALTKE